MNTYQKVLMLVLIGMGVHIYQNDKLEKANRASAIATHEMCEAARRVPDYAKTLVDSCFK